MTSGEVGDSVMEDRLASSQGQQDMAAARATNSVVILLHAALESSGVSRVELSRRLGVTESRVSQVVNGEGNLKVVTLARYLRALGYGLDLSAFPEDPGVKKIERRNSRRRVVLDVHKREVTHGGGMHTEAVITDPGFPVGGDGSSARVSYKFHASMTMDIDQREMATHWNRNRVVGSDVLHTTMKKVRA